MEFSPQLYQQPQPQAGRRHALADIMLTALQAVDPTDAVQQSVHLTDTELFIGNSAIARNSIEHIWVVGAGKATAAMAAGLEEQLNDAITGGHIVVKYGHGLPLGYIRATEAGHPVPDENGLQGSVAILALLNSATEHDLVISLISGGGSALLTCPPKGVALDDLQHLTKQLLRAGATINEINTIRKHLDQLKGGGLARAAAPARVISLILSDVVGNPLDVIASGPTVADPTTYADAWRILERYDLLSSAPEAVLTHLQTGQEGRVADTLKPGAPELARVTNLIIGSNEIAAHAALQAASEQGLNALLLSTYVEGEARDLGQMAVAIARQILASGEPLARPACVVLGGETTVTVRGTGRGGRNQEAALAAAIALDGLEDVTIAFFATDGTDGPTDSAGAMVDGDTLNRARAHGLDAYAYLQNNDAYAFFEALGDHLLTGPTRTNVNDLAFVVVW